MLRVVRANAQATQSGVGSSTTIANLSYIWSADGNLTSRTDTNAGLSESFNYDSLNRMWQAQVTGNSNSTLTLSYDAVGNIQSKSDVGSYTYNPNQPQQISMITPSSGPVRNFSYDPDGNLTNDGVHVNTWDALNRVTQIQDSSASAAVQISYTPDGARYQETTTVGVTPTTLTEVNPLFEVEGTSTHTYDREMIVGGTGVVAVRTVRDDGILTTRYITGDHLGSVSEITDEVGTVDERMSYDAFGQRTDPTTWQPYSGTVPNLTDITDKGYTGQQQLDAVAIIHMNGRAYDPQIGRFISADPTVPDPLYSQAFNRYAYVYNNPLSATDPSGFGPTTVYYPGPNGTLESYMEVDICFTPCGSGDVVTSPGNTDIANLGAIIVNHALAPTNVSLKPAPVTTPPTINSTPSQITGGNLTALAAPVDPCLTMNCGGDNQTQNVMNSTAGWDKWTGQNLFGGELGSTGLQGPPKNADGAGGPGNNYRGQPNGTGQSAVQIRPNVASGGPDFGNHPPTGSVGIPAATIDFGLGSVEYTSLGGIWLGKNGILYTASHGANQWTGAHAMAPTLGKAADAASESMFLINAIYGGYEYGSDIKAGNYNAALNVSINVALSGIFLEAGPPGWIAGGIYFGVEDTVGWGSVMSSYTQFIQENPGWNPYGGYGGP